MFNNNFYNDQKARFKGPPSLHPSLHSVQMRALTGVHGGSGPAKLNTRTITGLGMAMCTDDRVMRRYLSRLG